MSGDAHQDGDGRPSVDELGETLMPEPGTESWSKTSSTALVPTPEGIHFAVFGKTDVGLVREHNEDTFMLADLTRDSGPLQEDQEVSGLVTERGVAFAVCDGMGGAAAGEVASHMAVNTLFEKLRGDQPAVDRDDFASRLVAAVEEAGARIFLAAKKDRTRRGMGTTATVAGLVDKVLFIGQVGDSRCYVLRNGRLHLVTKDQSLVNQLIEAGQLTEAEARAFEHSNIILQALGTTEQVAVDLTFVELRRGDRLLLCSDGLSGLVHDDVIRQEMACVGPLPQLADRLIDLANAAGGHDNITCIVADFDGKGLDRPGDAATPFYQQYPLPAGDGDGATSGPTLPHVVRGMVPRAKAAARAIQDPLPTGPEPGPVSWSTAGLVLALFGLAAVITVASVGRPTVHVSSTPPPPAYADAEVPVAVTVRAALDRGELFVNGRSYGPLGIQDAVLLQLSPGPYHIEAREHDGTQIGKDVVIHPGLPTEVILIPPTD